MELSSNLILGSWWQCMFALDQGCWWSKTSVAHFDWARRKRSNKRNVRVNVTKEKTSNGFEERSQDQCSDCVPCSCPGKRGGDSEGSSSSWCMVQQWELYLCIVGCTNPASISSKTRSKGLLPRCISHSIRFGGLSDAAVSGYEAATILQTLSEFCYHQTLHSQERLHSADPSAQIREGNCFLLLHQQI